MMARTPSRRRKPVRRTQEVINEYKKLKDNDEDTLLLFLQGDFYEAYFEDAILLSKELELTLTTRKKGEEIPMAGFPYHQLEKYLKKLISIGYQVAICK